MHNIAYQNDWPEQDEDNAISVEMQVVSSRNNAFPEIVGSSDSMRSVFSTMEKVADTDSTILIGGETGTGKGLIARAIHDHSYRKRKPFITINCGAIPEHLLESELFGHERGAFTGATAAKPGKFELADGGTIFLDEIGDMSPDLQVKVLRVLEESKFERVGGCKTKHVDVRVIAATHRDLEEKVEKGEFRADLFYRLYVIPITIPPLRERRDDIPILVSSFLDQLESKQNLSIESISDKAMAMMIAYAWPGNVRELKNYIERLAVLHNGGRIVVGDLMQKMKSLKVLPIGHLSQLSEDGICFKTAVSEFEKDLILQSLKKSSWVKNKAAKLLHLKRTTLVEKIKRHHIEPNID